MYIRVVYICIYIRLVYLYMHMSDVYDTHLDVLVLPVVLYLPPDQRPLGVPEHQSATCIFLYRE